MLSQVSHREGQSRRIPLIGGAYGSQVQTEGERGLPGWQERPLFHRDRLSTFQDQNVLDIHLTTGIHFTPTEFTLTHATAHGFLQAK